MLVEAQVSSMKISRAELIPRCPARHIDRCRATSARSCSATRPDLFERQPEPGQRFVHRARDWR